MADKDDPVSYPVERKDNTAVLSQHIHEELQRLSTDPVKNKAVIDELTQLQPAVNKSFITSNAAAMEGGASLLVNADNREAASQIQSTQMTNGNYSVTSIVAEKAYGDKANFFSVNVDGKTYEIANAKPLVQEMAHAGNDVLKGKFTADEVKAIQEAVAKIKDVVKELPGKDGEITQVTLSDQQMQSIKTALHNVDDVGKKEGAKR